MVSLTSLWLPILVSAVEEFVASSIVNLVLGFLYLVVVSVLAADLAADALPRTAGVEDVCWFAGTIAFMGYSLALVQNSIWGRRSWWTTFKSLIDGVIYSTITGQVLGW